MRTVAKDSQMDSFHHWLMKSHLGFRKKVIASAQDFGLTAGQPKILEFLDEVGSAEQKTIADFCEIEPATVGSILSRMQSSGLIERKRQPHNMRSVVVTLTDKGKECAKQSQLMFDKLEETALEGLDKQQICLLREMLKVVYNNLQNSDADNQ